MRVCVAVAAGVRVRRVAIVVRLDFDRHVGIGAEVVQLLCAQLGRQQLPVALALRAPGIVIERNL